MKTSSSTHVAARLSLAFTVIAFALYCVPHIARVLQVSLPFGNAAALSALYAGALILSLVVSVVCGFIALSGVKHHGREGILIPAAIGLTLSALMLAPILYGVGYGISSAVTRVSARESKPPSSQRVSVQSGRPIDEVAAKTSAPAKRKNFITAAKRTDLVHDPLRNILYITAGSEVLRYSFSSNGFLPPFELGGNLAGIDLSPDVQTLAVADRSRAGDKVWIHLVNLAIGTNSRVLFDAASRESGTYSIAFGADNAIYTTSTFDGSGRVPFRRYELSARRVATLQEINQDTMLGATPDRRLIAFAEGNSSRGSFGVYDTEKKKFVLDGHTDRFNWEVAINRDGTLVAVPNFSATTIAGPSPQSIGNSTEGWPMAAAFHPVRDIAFFPWASTPHIRAYDTRTWKLVEQIDLSDRFEHTGGNAFVNGRLRTSQDGAWLFVTVQGGVCYVRPKLSNEFADINRR